VQNREAHQHEGDLICAPLARRYGAAPEASNNCISLRDELQLLALATAITEFPLSRRHTPTPATWLSMAFRSWTRSIEELPGSTEAGTRALGAAAG